MNVFLTVAVACMIVMFSVASVPNMNIGVSSRAWNLLHVPAFCGLTLLWNIVFGLAGLRARVAALGAAGIALLFGLAIEWHQLSIPGRYASRLDLALNLVGVGLGLAVTPVSRRLFTRWSSAKQVT